MKLIKVPPGKALSKSLLKVKPNRIDIENFQTNLILLLDRIDNSGSEELNKNLIAEFLKDTYYKTNYFINTKENNNLIIHNGKSPDSPVGVIIGTKTPKNRKEIVTTENLNTKAFHELILRYLRERIIHQNHEIKHLIITNAYEWFIFDSALFDRLFIQNKDFVQQFDDFENSRSVNTKTDFFYKNIAVPFINNIYDKIEFTYFNIHDYSKVFYSKDKTDDYTLIGLFKIFSPEHLLKLPFTNDSNSLDEKFYSELLHIVGLTEIRIRSKLLIDRKNEKERNSGTILEDTIIQLDSLDKINRLPYLHQFGETYQERLFNIALELCITWLNRILFLKLLESQLISYHKGDRKFSFLSIDKAKSYDDLNSLFFQILTKKHDKRNQDVRQAFKNVPYLNSSLFEPTELEYSTLFISNLEDGKQIPVYKQTVLKDRQGERIEGQLSALEYLFKFLDAYDFSSEGASRIQEDNKTLIHASVLGLIFEKINGYKDGAFFTPGFITMFMCRDTIRKAVLQKFNQTKGWNCRNFYDLYDKIENKEEANNIINSIKICDPAVGSGHFLVSALNEIIAIKNDLKILRDRQGKQLKEYQIEVVNDELIIIDEEGKLFEYVPTDKESQRVQEALFHEKQVIIENCLFGVDINLNSVKICQLRLWIELLKNAYYTGNGSLEALPDIDLNIKCGNSLISRFDIKSDLSQAFKKSKWSIDRCRKVVSRYRNAENKIFENSFEWRFEFPEVLDDNGNFIGFDVIIGNPPYGVKLPPNEKSFLKTSLFNSGETAILFIYRAYQLLNHHGKQSYIIPKAFTYSSNYSAIRKILKDELCLIVDCHKPWQEVKLEACIFQVAKNIKSEEYQSLIVKENNFIELTKTPKSLIDEFGFILNGVTDTEIELAKKIKQDNFYWGDVSTNKRGVGIQSRLTSEGRYIVLGGIDVERNTIKNTQRGFLDDISGIDEIGKIQTNSILVQNIVAHLTTPRDHIKIIAAVPPYDSDGYIILDTINQITFNNNVSNRFGCSLLNSKLINWYVYNFIYAKAIRTMHFDNVVTNRIPFPKKYFENTVFFDNPSNHITDRQIYDLFNLTEFEISIIESTFKQ